MRFVFDTNVIIDGFSDNFNAASQLIDAVINGQAEAAVTRKIVGEYKLILRRLINDPLYKNRIHDFFRAAKTVKPVEVRIIIDDPEDEKFVEAAVGGQADVLVTSDHHLLDLGEIGDTRIMKPTEALAHFEDNSSSGKTSREWMNFIKGIGLGL